MKDLIEIVDLSCRISWVANLAEHKPDFFRLLSYQAASKELLLLQLSESMLRLFAL